MANLNSEVKAKMNGAAKDFSQIAKQSSIAQTMGEQAGDVAAQALDRVGHAYEAGRDYVRHNPEKSVATAAVLGVAVGGLIALLFRRR